MKRRWAPVCAGCLRQLIVSPRFWVIAIVTALYLDAKLAPVREAMIEYGTRISVAGVLTLLMNDVQISALMTLSCLAMMFDLPAADEMQRYLMLRTGRRSWAKGQIAYCASIAVIYLLMFSLIALALLAPYAQFGNTWSAGMDVLMDYEVENLFPIDYWIPSAYSVYSAWLTEAGLHALMFLLAGLVLMNVNLWIDRRIGFFVLAVPIALDMLLQEFFTDALKYVSPSTLCRLSGLDYGDGMGRPTALFAACALASFAAVAGRLFLSMVKRRELRV